jgi:exopolysaccharide biosynthesis polyprenyl glycosylphosphotransferase
MGIVDDVSRARQASYRGVRVIGSFGSLRQLAEEHTVGTVIVAATYGQDADLIRCLLDLKMRGVEVVDMPRFYEQATGQLSIRHVDDRWFLHAGGFDILHSRARQRFKRFLDVVLASLGLAVSLPLMAVVALLVKLESRGPVFFRQERVGLDERPFRLVKFRSMVADAEEGTGPVWAAPADFRITRVGRLLRLTRLDELPQFVNVLRGEMSFIGPRPERAFFVERLKKEIPYYALRFSVKPGLSGWAQVNYGYGSSTEDAIEKLTYDLYYIKNMSFLLDLRILLKTVQVVVLARGT